MIGRSTTLLALTAAAMLAGGAAAADSTTAKAKPTYNCFFASQWRGWSSPDSRTIYLKVNINDVYRVDLANDTPELNWPSNHLIVVYHSGQSSICQAIDLDLAVAQGEGFRVPLIAKTLTKLTPEEVAAIPLKFRPN